MTMSVFDIVVLIAAACGLAMVVGGIWLLARGAIDFNPPDHGAGGSSFGVPQ